MIVLCAANSNRYDSNRFYGGYGGYNPVGIHDIHYDHSINNAVYSPQLAMAAPMKRYGYSQSVQPSEPDDSDPSIDLDIGLSAEPVMNTEPAKNYEQPSQDYGHGGHRGHGGYGR